MKGKVMSRKIVVLMGLLSVALCFAGGSTAWAMIPLSPTGALCLNCHVDSAPTPGNWTLLSQYQGETGCIGCHSSSTSSTLYIINPGGSPEITVPVTVFTGATEPLEFLASGNFWWVKGAAHGTPGDPMTDWTGGGHDQGGHNIFPGEPDERYTLEGVSVAPGHSSGCLNETSCHSNLNTVDTTYGPRQSCLKCHMMTKGTDYPTGFHHADDSGPVVGLGHYVPGDPGFDGYYCFLTGHMSGEGHGVAGIEDDDWEATVSSTDHNEYFGAQHDLDKPGGFGLAEDRHTSTAYCSGCHGNFHVASKYATGKADSAPETPYEWLRHPVGMVLPDDGDLDFHLYTVYDPNVPLGRPDLAGWTGPSDVVRPGVDIINCLSCHRAHGTPGGSHLRWDPTEWDACATCHITKRSRVEGQYICDSIDDCNDCHTAHGRSLRFIDGGTGQAINEFGGDHENESLVWMKVYIRNYTDDVAITVAANPYDTYVVVDASDINFFQVGDVVEIRDDSIHDHVHHPHQHYQQLTITSVDIGQNRYYFANDAIHAPHIYPVGSKLYSVELHDCTFPIPGDSPYVRGADPYDGICEVCHTQTLYWRNDGSGAAHYGGPGAQDQCTSCHLHINEWYGESPGDDAHNVHFPEDTGVMRGPDSMDCGDCHEGTNNDIATMVSQGKCEPCHSPGGAFNGVTDPNIGILYNWPDYTVSLESEIYNADGTLKTGKELWCSGCHDDVPASSSPGPSIEVIVDTLDAGLVCTWTYASGVSGAYNGDHYYHGAGSGSCTATWTPNLTSAETYNVYAWWRASPNRATNAKYTIHYEGSSETVEVNQQINSSQWNLLGTYPFAAGTTGYVVLNDNANGYVIADAIKLDNAIGATTNAPNVTGDNSTYGFYINGHNINCLSCHDASKEHIDHAHRTYVAGVTPYGDSYRLGLPSTKPSRYLCFVCHNSTEVLGQNTLDVSHTNFWNNDSYIENSHALHIGLTGIHFDSDWDGAIDSTESCITCHNVHGSPTEAMIRHGELISTYGTTDKVPALNFSYLGSSTLVGSTGGRMNLAGAGVGDNGVCWACHGAISYYRTPYLGPKVMPLPVDDPVANDGSGTATITAVVSDADGDVDTVTIDLTPIGGSANQPMTDNLDGTYSYLVTIPGTTADTPLTFEITATDAATNTGEGEATIIVVDPNSIYVDTVDAQLVCDWTITVSPGAYKQDHAFHAAGTGSCTATWTPNVPSAETYNVYAWWKASSNRATNAKYTIYHASGSQTVEVNQEINGSQWNYLGNFSFAAGTSGYVVLSDDADEYVIADAIKLTPSPPPPPETVIVDTPDAQFVCGWTYVSGVSGAYNDDHRYHAAGTGSCTATWTPNLVAGASYNVYAWWRASPNRATDAPYTIYYDGGSETVDVNQEINGSQWNLLGTYPFAAGASGYVVLTDDANEYVIADAVKFAP